MRRGAEQEKMEHQKIKHYDGNRGKALQNKINKEIGKAGRKRKALESLGHYCTYAVSGKTGELLWKHEPGDFEVHPAYDIGLSSFTHFKLLFHKYLLHEGEVSWHQYSSAIRQIMPHSWTDDFDTKLELAQFNKDKKKSDEPGVTDHISKGRPILQAVLQVFRLEAILCVTLVVFYTQIKQICCVLLLNAYLKNWTF
uniref:Uncharacterized protein n=1 Tax=Amphimedon queenslandica TaxID=400682 RepID=A0A1X7TI01_AMPQE